MREVLEAQRNMIMDTFFGLQNPSDHALLGDLLNEMVEAGVNAGAAVTVEVAPLAVVETVIAAQLQQFATTLATLVEPKRRSVKKAKPAKKVAKKATAKKRR